MNSIEELDKIRKELSNKVDLLKPISFDLVVKKGLLSQFSWELGHFSRLISSGTTQDYMNKYSHIVNNYINPLGTKSLFGDIRLNGANGFALGTARFGDKAIVLSARSQEDLLLFALKNELNVSFDSMRTNLKARSIALKKEVFSLENALRTFRVNEK
jgi:hypothetical protein